MTGNLQVLRVDGRGARNFVLLGKQSHCQAPVGGLHGRSWGFLYYLLKLSKPPVSLHGGAATSHPDGEEKAQVSFSFTT